MYMCTHTCYICIYVDIYIERERCVTTGLPGEGRGRGRDLERLREAQRGALGKSIISIYDKLCNNTFGTKSPKH